MATPFSHCSGQNLAVILNIFHPLTPYVHSISKSCLIYVKSISRIWSFLTTFTATTLSNITIIHSSPGLWQWPPGWIICFCPYTQSIHSSGQRSNQESDHVSPLLKTLLVPISLREKAMLPSAPWPYFLPFTPSSQACYSSLPQTHQAYSYLRAFTYASQLPAAQLPASLHFPSNFYLQVTIISVNLSLATLNF